MRLFSLCYGKDLLPLRRHSFDFLCLASSPLVSLHILSLSLLALLLPRCSSPQHPSPISFFRAPILYPLSSWHFPCMALIVQQLRSMRFPQEQKCCTSAAAEQRQSSLCCGSSDTCRTDDRLLHLFIPSSKTEEMT